MDSVAGLGAVPSLHFDWVADHHTSPRDPFDAADPPDDDDDDDTTVTKHYITGAGLKSVPKYILNDPTTVSLDAYDNRLYHIPRGARMTKSLQRLDLRMNAFTSFPRALLYMNRLQFLDFRQQNITLSPIPDFNVPEWVSQLHSLQDLRLPTIPRDHPRKFLSNGAATYTAKCITSRGTKNVIMAAPGTVVQPESLYHLMFSVKDKYGTRRLVVYSTRAEILNGLSTEDYRRTDPLRLRARSAR